jgi:hypothetical protein
MPLALLAVAFAVRRDPAARRRVRRVAGLVVAGLAPMADTTPRFSRD